MRPKRPKDSRLSRPPKGKRSRGETVVAPKTAFGHPMDYLGNRFVYVVISPRAQGLSIGVNMNPDKRCNFDCQYCEVDRSVPSRKSRLDVKVMVEELDRTFALIGGGRLRRRPWYRSLPEELLQLRHLTLSGDGEPTLAANFLKVASTLLYMRSVGRWPFFKIVLVTNATGLDLPRVQRALGFFAPGDEIWAKLDGGTQPYVDAVNRPDVRLKKILDNIVLVARRRPVVIQSLFPAVSGVGPSPAEVEAYVQRLGDLKARGAQIALVQIYSATRPTPNSAHGHLPLKVLSGIARKVRQQTGFKADVF